MNYEQARILKNVAKRSEVHEQFIEDIFDRIIELERAVAELRSLVTPLEQPPQRRAKQAKRTNNA